MRQIMSLKRHSQFLELNVCMLLTQTQIGVLEK